MSLDTLRGGLERLREILLRPLWTEDETLTSRRRCHFLVAFPLVAIAGGAYGFLVGRDVGIAPFPGSLMGAAAFGLFLHVQLVVEPLLGHLFGKRHGAEPLVPFFWDLGIGGLLAYLVTERMGAPVMPAITSATAIGALYAVVTGYLFCGGGVSDLVATLLASRGTSTPHRHEHSRAAALAARGELDAALLEYRMAMEADPADPVPYLRAARLLSRDLGRHEDALSTLREGLGNARTSEQEEARMVREIAELCELRLGDPARSAPHLARLLERQPGTPTGEWARRELAALKARMREPAQPPGGTLGGAREAPPAPPTPPLPAIEPPGPTLPD